MTFSALKERLSRRPGRTLLLEPWVFADEWEQKPDDAVCVGLRLMSETDKSKARAEAENVARELHPKGGPNFTDAMNDALVRQCAALGICDANDVTKPSQILPLAEEQVRYALTSRGARFIFEAHLRYEVEVSPLYPEASTEDIAELIRSLQDPVLLDLLPDLNRSVTKRYLRFALDAIRDVTGDDSDSRVQ